MSVQRLGFGWTSIALACAAQSPAAGQLAANFVQDQIITEGDAPFSVGVGDFDKDGHDDLAIVLSGENRVVIAISDGKGGFAESASVPVGGTPRFIAVGDVSSDGALDLCVTNWEADSWTLLFGNGDGSFTHGGELNAGDAPNGIELADVDDDGALDVIFTSGLTNEVWINLGNGIGGFDTPPLMFDAGVGPVDVKASDLDLDGNLDLVVANRSGGTITILHQEQPLLFSVVQTLLTGVECIAVDAADLSGDGVPDILSANGDSENVQYFEGDGAGQFLNAVAIPTGGLPWDVAITDVNNDGQLDAVATLFSADAVAVLTNEPLGPIPFTVRTYAVENGALTVALVDANDDQHIDVVVANWLGDVATLLRGDRRGGLLAPVTLGVGGLPTSAKAVDFNIEGRDQFAFVNGLDFVLRNAAVSEDARWEIPLPIFDSEIMASFDVGDFDVDARPDFIIADSFLDRITVLMNSENGIQELFINMPVDHEIGVRVGDFNADAISDAVIVTDLAQVTVLQSENRSALLHASVFDFATSFTFVQSVLIGNVNADQHPDIVILGTQPLKIETLMNNGDGSFTVAPQTSFEKAGVSSIHSSVLYDWTGDGLDDFVFGFGVGPSLLVAEGDGSGRFLMPPIEISDVSVGLLGVADFDDDQLDDLYIRGEEGVHVRPGAAMPGNAVFETIAQVTDASDIAVSDFDGDGDVDVAWTNTGNGQIVFLPGVTAGGVDPADFNGDGVVNGADLAALLSGWGMCDDAQSCAADLNADKVVDGLDLAALLAAWG